MNSNSFANSQRTIANLTNDDSKVLGNIKPKLKIVHERYNMTTNKYKTLNSSWTPLKDKNTNRTIFEERLDLVANWFDLWNDKQRKWFLLNILSRCRPSQICYLEDAFDNIGVYERKDFTQVLPKYLSIYVFSFLSPKDLCRCAQVSSHWKYISEQDEVWMPKCLKFGWYLPYKPSVREIGAWKCHYAECIHSIDAHQLTKQVAYKYRETLYQRELTDGEKEKYLFLTAKRVLDSSESHDLLSSRKPWVPSSAKPNDLKTTDKFLYSAKTDPNMPTPDNYLSSYYNTVFGLPKKSFMPHLKTLEKSISIDQDMLDDFRLSLPAHLSTMKDSYKTMRKSESDLFSTKLTKSSFDAYQSYKTNQTQLYLTETGHRDSVDHPHVIFISSKVPCNNLLLESLKLNTIAIQYEFEFTDINTLISLLDSQLKGRRAKSIGFFLHFEKPGQIILTKESVLYKVNINDEQLSHFFMKLVERLVEATKAYFDFFVPLGSSVDGLELVEKLHKLTGIDIRVPTGFLYNYKFIKSKWINSPDLLSSPLNEYFIEEKFDIWLKYSEILSDAHDRIAEHVMNGYLPDLDKLSVERISGKILYDTLASNEFLFDSKIQNELETLISNAALNKSENFFQSLSNELSHKLSDDKTQNSQEQKDEPSDSLLRSDAALKSFIKYKSEAENVEQCMRTQVALELIKSEINYMKSLEIVQKYYAKPLNAGNKHIVSQSVIDMLFGDLTVLYNSSKEMVKEFNLRLKTWNSSTCLGDVMSIFSNNIQSYMNYANNNDSIINTLDKLVASNPLFRGFLLAIDNSNLTNMMTIQDLMGVPWPRIKEYMNILASLQLHTAKNHPDQEYISNALNKIRELHLYIKQLQDRVEKRYKMINIQKRVLNAPLIAKAGRYLILEQKALLLNKMTLKFVKDMTCFLFNDGLLLAFRIKQHFPFTKHCEEVLVFHELIDCLYNLEISDAVDLKNLNVICIKQEKYNEFYLGFESFESKYNFLNSLKLARKLAI